MSSAQRPLPDLTDPEFAEHWAGLKQRRLLVPRCDGCGTFTWPPRPACPSCAGFAFTWAPVAGTGSVHSWTVVSHRTVPGFDLPYVVVLVEIDGADGLRLLGGYRGDPERLEVAAPVVAGFNDVTDEVTLLEWGPSPHVASTENTKESHGE